MECFDGKCVRVIRCELEIYSRCKKVYIWGNIKLVSGTFKKLLV